MQVLVVSTPQSSTASQMESSGLPTLSDHLESRRCCLCLSGTNVLAVAVQAHCQPCHTQKALRKMKYVPPYCFPSGGQAAAAVVPWSTHYAKRSDFCLLCCFLLLTAVFFGANAECPPSSPLRYFSFWRPHARASGGTITR